MVFQNDILAGSSGASGTSTAVHTIDQSIRFNDDDSPYMYKAFSGAGDLQKATMSCWLKMGNISTNKGIFTFISDKPLELDSNNNLKVHAFGSNRLITDREFRDPSAWYHIVLSIDSTQAVSTERIRLYVNGQRETSFSTESYPSQNTNGSWWSSNFFQIGRTYGTSNYMDGYLAEIVYIDGTALDPSSFGEYNSSGIWIPKDVSGLTFGTNGCYIKGEDSSDLGNDSSGNGNDFTTSGLASHDQMVGESPTNNFAVINSLIPSTVTYSEGNLKSVISANESTSATMGASSGKWYFEVYVNTVGSAYLGICSNQTTNFTSWIGQPEGVGCNASAGDIYISNPTPASTSFEGLPTYTSSDIIGIAFDVDNQKMWWSKNGQWYSGNSASESTINISDVEAGNNAFDFSYINEQFILPMLGTSNTGSTTTCNFGQDGTFAGNVTAGGNSDGNGVGNFKYSVPSGYLALCTKNLGS